MSHFWSPKIQWTSNWSSFTHCWVFRCPCRCGNRNDSQERARAVSACRSVPKEKRFAIACAHNLCDSKCNWNPQGCLFFFIYKWIPWDWNSKLLHPKGVYKMLYYQPLPPGKLESVLAKYLSTVIPCKKKFCFQNIPVELFFTESIESTLPLNSVESIQKYLLLCGFLRSRLQISSYWLR